MAQRTFTPLFIGIAGGTGSGKTSVTERIVEQIGSADIAVIPHDTYYRDMPEFGAESTEHINFDHPSSLETELLIRHLRMLRAGETIDQPLYNYTTYRRLHDTKRVVPQPIMIIEGILIFTDKMLRDLFDIKIFIDTDADERIIRRIRRDTTERGRSLDSILEQYVSTVKPMHLEFVEPSKQWADIIVPRGAENLVAIDMVVAMIQNRLSERLKS